MDRQKILTSYATICMHISEYRNVGMCVTAKVLFTTKVWYNTVFVDALPVHIVYSMR